MITAELGDFKPCIYTTGDIDGGLPVTTFLLEDVTTVSRPVFDGVYHTVDWLVDFNGRIVGVQVWARQPTGKR